MANLKLKKTAPVKSDKRMMNLLFDGLSTQEIFHKLSRFCEYKPFFILVLDREKKTDKSQLNLFNHAN